MRAGALRFEVTLERRVDSQQDGGQVVFEYEEIGQDWASIEPISGREFPGGIQIQADATHRIRMRYRDDIDETCRIRFSHAPDESPLLETFYDIASPPIFDTKTGRREMVLLCVVRGAEGWRGGPDYGQTP